MTKKWMSVLLVLFLALAVPRAAALEPTEPGIGTAVLALSGEEPVQAGGAFALTVSRIYAPDNETGSTSSLSIAEEAPVVLAGTGPAGTAEFHGSICDGEIRIPAYEAGSGSPFCTAGEWTLTASFLAADEWDEDLIYLVQTSLTLTVLPGEADHLELLPPEEPPEADADQGALVWSTLSLRVADPFGNLCTGAGGVVTAAPSDAEHCTLEGELSAEVSGGTAVFRPLGIRNGSDTERPDPAVIFQWEGISLEHTFTGVTLPGKKPEPELAPTPPFVPAPPVLVVPAPDPEPYRPAVTPTPPSNKTTVKNSDGSQTTVETQQDGTVITVVERQNGSTFTTTVFPSGQMQVVASIPAAASRAAQVHQEVISIPMPALPAVREMEEAPLILLHTGVNTPVLVEIPVSGATAGTVAVLLQSGGTREVVKQSLAAGDGITLPVSDGAAVKIVDNTKLFDDVNRHWAQEAVQFVTAREIFSGIGEGSFQPEAPMTRSMLVTTLAKYDGVDVSGGAVWYEKGVEWAIAAGVSDGSAPEAAVTREQLATMLYNYAGRPSISAAELNFTDFEQISDYARDAVCWAAENGLISGMDDGTLAPGGSATRAQVASILMNYCKHLFSVQILLAI